VRKLPRPVWLFGLVSLFNDFASEMIYPLLPAFVTGVLGGGALSLGALDGAADFAAAFVKYGSGRLADEPRRRGALIILGYLVAVIVRPVIALAGAAWQVIGLRVTDRVGKGIRTPPRDALIAEVTPPELHGRAFGFHRGLDHAGAVLGPLAAYWLLTSQALDVRGVIGASIVPGIVVLVLAVWAVRDGRKRDGTIGTGPVAAAPVRGRALPPALFAICAFYLLRMPETLILLRTQQLGVSVASVLLLWAALHVVRSSFSFVGGALSDRFGTARVMWLGWVSYAAIAYGFARAGGPQTALVLFLVLGVVAGLTESPERAIVSKLAGGKQGTGFGVYHAATGIAALAGGLLLGALYQSSSAALAFTVSALGGIALAVLWPAVASGRESLPAR
jgi:MFS family permease